jgi:hypothetical protein
MKRSFLAVLGLALAACGSTPPPIPQGAAVIIKESHYHTRYCGHYRFGTQWYYVPQHRHGVDCDHELVNGEWILAED